jgi:hypothetical protein
MVHASMARLATTFTVRYFLAHSFQECSIPDPLLLRYGYNNGSPFRF